MDGSAASTLVAKLTATVSKVLVGKEDRVELALVAFLARGHLLVEDVPGVGKTTLARALAAAVGLDFRRVQFTSDLMPTDVLGGSVYERESGRFRFEAGPVFTQVLLADEINRTTPRTQSALLEAMGERQVSIDGETRALPEPFFVIATQNPQDFFGTYPLPESQLDRFLIRTKLGYPPPEAERRVLSRASGGDPVDAIDEPIGEAQWVAAQRAADDVRVEDPVYDYLHALILETREHRMIEVGASTRAALAFASAIRARAIVRGRDYAIPDDVKALAVPVLAHRIRPKGETGTAARTAAERIMRELLDSVAVSL